MATIFTLSPKNNRYFTRMILNPWNSLFLKGPVGIGKTSYLEYLCRINGWGCFTMDMTELGYNTDFTGATKIPYKNPVTGEDDFKQLYFPHATIKECIDFAEAHPDTITVLFLDELNRANITVTAAAMTLITARQIGNYKLPENVRIVAGGNDGNNDVTPMDQAKVSRFKIVPCGADVDVFLNLDSITNTPAPASPVPMIKEKHYKVHPIIESVLKAQPQLLWQDKTITADADGNVFEDEDNEISNIACPRTIQSLNWDMCEAYGEYATKSVEELKDYIAVFTGPTLTTEAFVNEVNMAKVNNTLAPTIEAPTKPASLDVMLSMKTVTDIYDICQKMSDDEKSECINYMLYDTSTDYTTLIKVIMENFQSNMLTGNNMQTTIKLMSTNQYNRDTYVGIINSNSALATTFKGAFGV